MKFQCRRGCHHDPAIGRVEGPLGRTAAGHGGGKEGVSFFDSIFVVVVLYTIYNIGCFFVLFE